MHNLRTDGEVNSRRQLANPVKWPLKGCMHTCALCIYH